jgi:phosphoglycolate phosphatase-like HAD superfamily hydrolase
MFEKYRAVIFDVDGTLVDLMNLHARSYQQVFARVCQIHVPSPVFFRELFDLESEKAVFGEALRRSQRTATPALISQLISARTIAFEKLAKTANEAAVISGVRQTLINLRKAGKKVLCISGNNRRLAVGIMKKTGLWNLVDDAAFLMDAPELLSKEALLTRLLVRQRIPKLRACFVGDTPSDIVVGKKVGVDTVAVATGVVPVSKLKEVGYGRVVRKLSFKSKTKLRPLRRR